MDYDERQGIVDGEHLRLLRFFYYLSAGVTAFLACMPLMHVALGLMFVLMGRSTNMPQGQAPPEFVGWFMAGMGGFFVLLGWTLAFFKFLTGRFIARRRHHTFCLVIATITCLGIPYGTVLGIMTFVVLLRDSVKATFESGPSFPPPLTET